MFILSGLKTLCETANRSSPDPPHRVVSVRHSTRVANLVDA